MSLTLEILATAVDCEMVTLKEGIRKRNFLNKNGLVREPKLDFVVSSLTRKAKAIFGMDFVDMPGFTCQLLRQAVCRLYKGQPGPISFCELPDKRSSHDMSCK